MNQRNIKLIVIRNFDIGGFGEDAFQHTGYLFPCIFSVPACELTRNVKNGLEAKSEPANFKRIFLLDTGVDTFDSLPVFCSEDAIIVHAKSRCLFRQSGLKGKELLNFIILDSFVMNNELINVK